MVCGFMSPPSRGRGLKLPVLAELVSEHMSPPSRGRGLKPSIWLFGAGVWWSPPSRGRGLKQFSPVRTSTTRKSPPSRGRGLKQPMLGETTHLAVAPFTGAWIETPLGAVCYQFLKVAPFTGAWIETVGVTRSPSELTSRPLHGGVD